MPRPPEADGRGRLWRAVACALLLALMAACIAKLPQQGLAASGLGGRAQTYLDETLGRAAALFLSGRVLNGIISVIQSSQVSVGIGVGGQIAVGEALDPLNDLVEQFSAVMLACVVSLGLQKLLFDIGLWIGTGAVIPVAAAVLAFGLWLPGGWMRRLGARLLLLGVMLAFAVPAASLLSGALTDQFAGVAAARAEAEVRGLSQQVETTRRAVAEQEQGLWERLFGRVEMPVMSLDQIQGTYETLIRTNVESLVELIKIFVLQTILLPLGTLWLMVWLVRSAAR